jgi:methylated-DNA-protein-cysteine methyltransferase-like protein
MNEEFENEARDAASDERIVTQIYNIARRIPTGRVLAYGALGAKCDPPISGYICGRIMNRAVHDVPWWRVVAKDGRLPISKRNPHLADEQRQKLKDEGVEFDDDSRVLMDKFSWDEEQNSLF